MATLSNQDDFIKTALRLPRNIHAQIQESAEKHGRSMNSEIVSRLENSFNMELDNDLLQYGLSTHREELKAQRDLNKSLMQQVSMLRKLLLKAAGILKIALISGKDKPIPLSDIKWMSDEANHLSSVAEEDGKP